MKSLVCILLSSHFFVAQQFQLSKSLGNPTADPPVPPQTIVDLTILMVGLCPAAGVQSSIGLCARIAFLVS